MFRTYSIISLIICSKLGVVFCVPPTPTDSLLEDVKAIKERQQEIAGMMKKWSLIYSTQIEPRVVSTATMLTSIDSNVKSLQDRAHVWDTFQLHVSAWNDQMSITDRKIDIISKAQEKILALDAKLNTIGNMEYKLENIMKRLDSSQESLLEISKKVEENTNKDAGLFGEFATRGILSTLKQIERKLDKIQLTQMSSKIEEPTPSKGKLTISCNTPPIVEELLTDVSSKVDIIFDKMNGKYEDEFEDYLDEEMNATNKVVREVGKQDEDARLVKKLLKRISQPCKDFSETFNDLRGTLENLENNTIKLLDGQDRGSGCFNEENVILKLDHLFNYINYTEKTRDMTVHSHFLEQKNNFESFFNNKLNQLHGFCKTSEPIQPEFNVSVFETEKLDCSNLDVKNVSGIYKLGSRREFLHFDYFTRMCILRNGKHWTVFQSRGDFTSTPKDFNQNWIKYRDGFGDLNAEFWFGNEFIHRLTEENDVTLRVELEDFNGNLAWAEYDTFKVDSEENNYKITIGNYRGNASDSFSSHNESFFSTFDKKNDEAPECCPCAASYGGGWWFNSCFEANLNGVYHKTPTGNDYFRGIIWEHWLGNYSLKKSRMMLRVRENQVETTSASTLSMPTTFIPYFEDP